MSLSFQYLRKSFYLSVPVTIACLWELVVKALLLNVAGPIVLLVLTCSIAHVSFFCDCLLNERKNWCVSVLALFTNLLQSVNGGKSHFEVNE